MGAGWTRWYKPGGFIQAVESELAFWGEPATTVVIGAWRAPVLGEPIIDEKWVGDVYTHLLAEPLVVEEIVHVDHVERAVYFRRRRD